MSQNSSSISCRSLFAEGAKSHFRVIVSVRWMVCSCISRYILLWCHIVSTPVNTSFIRLNGRVRGDCGEGGRGNHKIPDCSTVSVRFYSSLYCLWLNGARDLFICLSHSVLLSKFFFYSHTCMSFCHRNTLVMHQKVFVLFFFCLDGVKKDWGHMFSETATYTKVGQNSRWSPCQHKQGELKTS